MNNVLDQLKPYPYEADWKLDLHPGAPGACRVNLPLVVVRQTPKAILARDPARREFWLPLSQVDVGSASRAYRDELLPVREVFMPAWLARKVWAGHIG